MFVDCPADELAPCYFYEYSRESETLREACAGTRPEVPPGVANGFDYYLSSSWVLEHGELVSDPARVFMLWPEWPDKPYLRIPAAERQRRLSYREGNDPRDAHLKKLAFFGIARANPGGLHPVSPVGSTEPSVEAWSEALISSQGRLGWPACEINPSMWEVVFRIDWKACSDAQLIEMFKAWLQKYRPATSSAAIENKNVTNRFEAHLKELGALRVLRNFKDAAIPNDIGLYQTKGDWAKAKLVAQGVIEWFSV